MSWNYSEALLPEIGSANQFSRISRLKLETRTIADLQCEQYSLLDEKESSKQQTLVTQIPREVATASQNL